jgi:hypothetical protein
MGLGVAQACGFAIELNGTVDVLRRTDTVFRALAAFDQCGGLVIWGANPRELGASGFSGGGGRRSD